MSSGMQDIIDDLRDENLVLSQSLQVANSERDLLRRQVEELATSLTEATNELGPYGGYKYQIDNWREQIKQAKKGGGGAC